MDAWSKEKLLIVERIAEGLAVCETEDRQSFSIALELLPPDVCEGDCLLRQPDGSLLIDPEETQRRRRSAIDLFNSLKKKK